jgi:hypothetical protein
MAPTGDGGGPEARNRMLRAVGGVVFARPLTGHIAKTMTRGARNKGPAMGINAVVGGS